MKLLRFEAGLPLQPIGSGFDRGRLHAYPEGFRPQQQQHAVERIIGPALLLPAADH